MRLSLLWGALGLVSLVMIPLTAAHSEDDPPPIRAGASELKKVQRLALVAMISEAKQRCRSAHSGSEADFRRCFREEIKNGVRSLVLQKRAAKSACLRQGATQPQALAGCLLASLNARPRPAEPRFQETECPIPAPALTRCGKVRVPFDHAKPEGKQIELAVAVLPQTGSGSRGMPPLVFLEGGPGGQSLASIALWEGSIYRKQADIVLFDQRGTGFSEPKLDCGAYDRAYVDSISGTGDLAASIKAEADALEACFADYRKKGVDFGLFTSVQAAADVESIRQALGVERVDLLGVSYGSRLALTTLRDFPASVRHAVVESFLPVEESMFADASAAIDKVFAQIFASCDREVACRNSFPDFEADFDALFTAVEAEPQTVILTDENGDHPIEVEMGPPQLATAIYRLISSAEGIRYLPLLTDLAANGDFRPLAAVLIEIETVIGDQIDPLVNFATLCNEEYDSPTRRTIGGRAIAATPEEPLTTYDLVCTRWPQKAPASEFKKITTDAPLLILSGAFDPVTPVGWAQKASAALPGSRLIVFPAGHGELSAFPGCAATVAAAFLADPQAPLKQSCLKASKHFDFITE